jgi:chromosome segregation ATPase
MEKVEEKVNRLETAFEEFTRTVGLEFNKVYNAIMLSHINYDRISQDIVQLGNRIESTRELLDNFIKESEKQRQEDRQKFNEFKDEMKEFKDEMRSFKDGMETFKERVDNFIEGVNQFKDEMKEFKDGMETFKERVENFIDGVNQFKDEMKDFKDEMKDFKDEMKDFKDEMKEFKDEMKDFKDEMKVFKDEMKEFKDEMKDFKDEMKDFKDDSIDFKAEMKSFKDEMREEHRKMNQQWGELANKMGTIVEDIIYPATRPVLEKYFNCELETTMMNITRKKDGIKDEFDVIAVSADKVFLIEVKSTMRQQYVDDFKNKKLERFRFLFSEYNDKTLVPILATLRYEDSMLAYVTRNNIYAMAYREWDYMDILNFEDITI